MTGTSQNTSMRFTSEHKIPRLFLCHNYSSMGQLCDYLVLVDPPAWPTALRLQDWKTCNIPMVNQKVKSYKMDMGLSIYILLAYTYKFYDKLGNNLS